MNTQSTKVRVKSRMVVGLAMTCAVSLLASSCATPEKNTGVGAAAGGGTGALVGGLAGGWKGALIGGAVGAVAGGAVGNYLDKQANELKQVAETKRTQDGILVNLKNDLLFDTGSSDLKPQAQAQLTQLGDIIAKYPKDRLQIQGFTDSTGSLKLNELLSQQRAQVVSNELMQRGVKPAQINVVGMGPLKPIASNDSAAGRSKNRRVELHIDVPQTSKG
jgi:outer membrane protein OmpA-like peptidoglycan-associated protein